MDNVLEILSTRAIAETHANDNGSYRAIVFTTNELQELYSSYPEVIQMDSTFGTNIHGYKLIHVVCVDKYLRTHSVWFGLLSDLLAETMALFVDSWRIDNNIDWSTERHPQYTLSTLRTNN